MSLSPGNRLGVFEITGPLGVGGMGEVYRARDTRLGREVAIKILPRAFTSDPDRLARFEREARMLATLNHPHIGAIYGLEESDGVRALVLELVEGSTLAERIARGPLPPAEALDVARQIADALDAAHEKGIVHRDLKPANVKITPAGAVKVLDFGLAKPDEASTAPDLSRSPTVTALNTGDGIILGTAAYMSPEQARGQAVDKRTDIWAFGCVLYEMLTGRSPFGRGTITDTLAAIVDREPDWSALPSATPPTVRRVLSRCLEKDQRRRVRDIGDVRADLDVPAESAAPGLPAAPPVSSRLSWVVAGAATLLAIAVMVWASRPSSADTDDATGAAVFSRIVRVTTGPAREFGPVLSPDGKWVAYVSNVGESPNVWVRFLSGGEAVNLTASSGLDISTNTGIGGLEVSPDGTRIAVMAKTRGSTMPYSTWELPAPLPGVPRKILDESLLGMRWSPDGRQIAFIRAGAAAGDALFVADADGTNRREIIPARDGGHVHWPAWSADGAYIYFMRTLGTLLNLDRTEIYRIAVAGGMMEPVVTTLRRTASPVPLAAGRGLVYAANPTGAELALWWRSEDGTRQERLTTGVGEYSEPRMTADGRSLVFTLYELRQSLMRIAVTGPAGQLSPVTDGYRGDLDPSVASSGERVVFSSSRAGERHIWTARLDGSDARPLTSGGVTDDRPAFSPDGRQVAFLSDRDGRRGIWLIGADGGLPRKLIDVAPTSGLSWSPDGREILYAASTGDWPGMWSVAVGTGQARRIPAPGVVAEPTWSPKGDVIAYLSINTSGPSFSSLAFVSPSGEPQYTNLPAAPPISSGFANGIPAWSPDGRQLAIPVQNANAPAAVWMIAPGESAPSFRRLLQLPGGPRMRGISWTPDGSALIVGMHDTTSDIVLLDQAQ